MLDENSTTPPNSSDANMGAGGAEGAAGNEARRASAGLRSNARKNAVDELDEDIANQEEKLRKLKDRRKAAIRAQREKNEKALLDLVRAQKWEDYPPEAWASVASQLDALLKAAHPLAA